MDAKISRLFESGNTDYSVVNNRYSDYRATDACFLVYIHNDDYPGSPGFQPADCSMA